MTSAALLAGTFSQAVFAAPSYNFQENTTEGLVPVKEVLFEEGFENAVSVNEGSLWGTAQKNLSVLKNETSAAVGNGFLTVTGKANAEQSLILKSTEAIKGKFAVEFKFKIAGGAAVPLLFGAGNSAAEENRAVEIGIDAFTSDDVKFYRNLTYTKSDKTQNPLVDITSPWRTNMDFNKWFLLHGDGDPWAPYSRDWYALTCKDIQNNKHLKNSANKISIKHFKDEKFLMLKSGNSMNYYGLKLCNEAGFVPDTILYFDQLMTSYNMSASGLGICFVTDTLVKEVAANDNLLYYKIDSDFAERTVYLLRKKKRYLNRAVKEFIDVASSVYGELKNLP